MGGNYDQSMLLLSLLAMLQEPDEGEVESETVSSAVTRTVKDRLFTWCTFEIICKMNF